MKNFAGAPGTWTGLIPRMAQCLFAAASIASMATTKTFFSYTAFCYLIASMGLQVIWSSGLAFMDAYALLTKKVLHQSCTSQASMSRQHYPLAAAASFSWHNGALLWRPGRLQSGRRMHKIRDGPLHLAFLSWITIAISSLIMLWLLAAG
ncbi:CASP-like protein 5B3 [Sesamum alatum]|uniref:CASP-like protein n=1 Tax=Sesamum alatum TaxID=300844 RepID=A0AAE1YCY8_9LAMI|nr:CASP-like protein 5B3 [Sesamum alatum]